MAYKNIFIAVDGSKFSEYAVEKGIELAEQTLASVTLLTVIDMSQIVSTAAVGGIIDPEVMRIYKDDAEKVVNGLAKKYPYGKTATMVIDGIPQDDIYKTARSHKADLIVMGTHGRTGLSHVFMGSVAEHVVRHSRIPVLIIPAHTK
jgi:nucleotide-binding universal stress UspA family protein